eukprot:GSMAST32.ASY1.ANO1.483.1 assembled CDS
MTNTSTSNKSEATEHPTVVISGLKLWHHGAKSSTFIQRAHEYFVMLSLGLYSKVVMNVLNDTQITEGQKLGDLIHKKRPQIGGHSRGLVTVSNHVTAVDDPGVVAAVTPWSAIVNVDIMRWTLCAENRCFNKSILSSFFRGGKVLPVIRGGGVLQPAMQNIVDKLSAGEWIHFFPTGKRYGEGKLGQVRNGVGRAIKDASVTPLVVPFYHRGMTQVLNKANGEKIPITLGKKMYISVGRVLDFHDYIMTARAEGLPEEDIQSYITNTIKKELIHLQEKVNSNY